MKVHMASINHRHGTNMYAGKTQKDLYLKLADYVGQWWESEIPDEPKPKLLKSFFKMEKASYNKLKDAVHAYFESCRHESLDIGEDKI